MAKRVNQLQIKITSIVIQAEGPEAVEAALEALPQLIGSVLSTSLSQPPPRRRRKLPAEAIVIDHNPQEVRTA